VNFLPFNLIEKLSVKPAGLYQNSKKLLARTKGKYNNFKLQYSIHNEEKV